MKRMAAKRDKKEDYALKCQLIELVKEYPLIYDKEHIKHFNRDAKIEAWNEIATVLKIEGKCYKKPNAIVRNFISHNKLVTIITIITVIVSY